MLHPGYVKTDMNKGFGQLTAEEAARIACVLTLLFVCSFLLSSCLFSSPPRFRFASPSLLLERAHLPPLHSLTTLFRRTEKVFLAISPKDNGKFLQWEGKPMPW